MPRSALTRPDATASPARIGALAHRDYRLLLSGTVLTQLGQWMQQVALGWLVLDLTGSAFYLGLVGFLRSIPMLFLSLPGGLLADRMDRSRLLATSQAAAALFSLVLALLVATAQVKIWHVLALTFLAGSAMALVFPVRQALVPGVVPRHDLASAVGLNSAGNNMTRMVGPALAGVLVTTVGIAICFFVQVVGLLLALWTSLAIRLPRSEAGVRAPGRSGTAWGDLEEAFVYIRSNRVIANLLLVAAAPTVFGMPYISFLPAFARDLQIGASGLGLLMMVAGVGSVAGSVGFAAAGDFRRKGLVQLTGAGLFGLSLVGFSLASSLPASLAFLALAGVSSSVYMATNNTLLQTRAPNELRGRILSVYMLTWGLMPLGTLPLGVLADRWGASTAVAIGGGLCVLLVVALAARSPELRSLR